MDQPQLYSKYQGLQRTDASFVVENYLRLIKWKKENDIILDIGCGDGQVTMEILFPQLPTTIKKIVITDVSDNMLKHAKNTYLNRKTEFVKFDISSEVIPEEFCFKFDHIFSFYCLHWIQNQRLAFKNMFKMLSPGGDILITFLANNPIFNLHEQIANTKKWSPYMKDCKSFISPYQHSKNSEKELEKILLESGFVCHVCRSERRCYTYSSMEDVKNSLKAVNPFIGRIPKNELDDFISDYTKGLMTIKDVVVENANNNNNNDERILCYYNLFIVYASKPSADLNLNYHQ